MRKPAFGKRLASGVLSALMLFGFAPANALAANGAIIPQGAPALEQATYTFGTNGDLSSGDLYSGTGNGFQSVEYPADAYWNANSVYIPREETLYEDARFVTDHEDYVEIAGKSWRENEIVLVNGTNRDNYFFYVETSNILLELEPWNYDVAIEFVNPTNAAYVGGARAEDINRGTVTVPAGGSAELTFALPLIDSELKLALFEATDSIINASDTARDDNEAKSVYVKSITLRAHGEKQAAGKSTIYLAGDSTVQTYVADPLTQVGWGQKLAEYFGGVDSETQSPTNSASTSKLYDAATAYVDNVAIGGRSSKLFYDEGRLDEILFNIGPGDYLFVQWGHNDSTKNIPNRYVAEENFAENLMRYVNGALQRGATPVLVTPVSQKSGWIFDTYRQEMFKISQEYGIPLIDLGYESSALLQKYGTAGTEQLYFDGTHPNEYGADTFAKLIARILDTYETANQEGTSIYFASEYYNVMKQLGDSVSYYIPTDKPGDVDNLMFLTGGSSTISLSWNAVVDTELYYIYRQQVTEDQTESDVTFDENSEYYAVSLTNSYTDTGLGEDEYYVYAVKAFNVNGLSDNFSNKALGKTKVAAFRFDVQIAGAPVLDGWTEVNQRTLYTPELGYGWLGAAPSDGRNRATGKGGVITQMIDDFLFAAEHTFVVDLPDGDYELTIYGGDTLGKGTIPIEVEVEGEYFGKAGVSSETEVGVINGSVTVEDGQLTIYIRKSAANSGYLCGVTITPLLQRPTGLEIFEVIDEGQRSSFRIRFDVDEDAYAYNLYMKGETDEDFELLNTFTRAEYEADSQAVSGYSALNGEEYELYITGVRGDGYETRPSDSVYLDTRNPEVAKPAPVQNITEVTHDLETGEITFQWDANAAGENILYYNVYYAGNFTAEDKGFAVRGLTKLGNTLPGNETTWSYDSEGDITFHMPYYFVVEAVNIGGRSEHSYFATGIYNSLTPYAAESLADRALVAIDLAGQKGAEIYVTATDSNGDAYESGVFLSWRVFEEDPEGITFDVYRNGTQIDSDVPVSNIIDEDGAYGDKYEVVVAGQAPTGNTVEAWEDYYLELDLNKPDAQTMPLGGTTFYTANDMSVGDLDGDGTYELIVKWYPSNAQDNSGSGYTGTTIIDAYKVDWNTGATSLMWRIDLGINIRSGAHYTQFQVWDYDGDGKAEIAMKTADTTTWYDSGLNVAGYIGNYSIEDVDISVLGSVDCDYRNASGYILDGPEYFTIFNGQTGEAIDTVDYIPERGEVAAWGDAYGNRVDRFLSASAYLDGEKAYAVFARGYYTRTVIAAYELVDTDGDGLGDKIETYWVFDTNEAGNQYESQGNHSIAVADIDGDGKDEIIYGSLVVDHDGTVWYSTGLGHGDAQHTSDWVMWNDGLEIMSVHEHSPSYSVEVRDALTGEFLMAYIADPDDPDVGRGLAADIDPTSLGGEWWASDGPGGVGDNEWYSTDGGVFSADSRTGDSEWDTSNLIQLSDSTPSINFSMYWSGDLLAEMQDHKFTTVNIYVNPTDTRATNIAYYPNGVNITGWDYENNEEVVLFYSEEVWSSNGTKGNLGLVADVLGDWREEIIVRLAGETVENAYASRGGRDVVPGANDNKVRVYSTTIQTDYVIPTLVQNHTYRLGVAWQNVGYNQPTHLDYSISQDLIAPTIASGEYGVGAVELLFNEASDGEYGHELVGYEIWRSETGDLDDYEVIATMDLDGLVETDPPNSGNGNGNGGNEEAQYEEGATVWKFDFGGGNNNDPASFTRIIQDAYDNSKGYGFTTPYDELLSEDSTVRGNAINFANTRNLNILSGEEDDEDLLKAVDDAVRAPGGEIVFEAVVEPGRYKVDVYAFAATGSGNEAMFEGNEISVNGKPLGTALTTAASLDTICKTAYVDIADGENIVVQALNESATFAFLNAVLVTQMNLVEPEEPEEPEAPETPADPYVLRVDFGSANGVADGYELIDAGNEVYTEERGFGLADALPGSNAGYANNYNETDALFGDYLYSYGGRTHSFLADVPNGTYTVEVLLGGTANSTNWITRFVVNGTDIPGDDADNYQLSSSENRTLTLRDIVVEDGRIKVDFIGTASRFLYISALRITQTAGDGMEGGGGGTVVVDDRTWYTYTDNTVASGKTYYYKAAGLVETLTGETRSAHPSKSVMVQTLVDIDEVYELELKPLWQDHVLANGQTLKDLLPIAWPVKDADGTDVEVAIVEWDISGATLTQAGEYKIYATVREASEPLEATLVVQRNSVKHYDPIELTIVENMDTPLPATVAVELQNGTTRNANVTWTNWEEAYRGILDTYNIEGVFTGYSGYEGDPVSMTVHVIKNHITGVAYPEAIEVPVGADMAEVELPETLTATIATGETKEVAVGEWHIDEIDTSEVSVQLLRGTVEDELDFDGDALLYIRVDYPVIQNYDFGIKDGYADGFTVITNQRYSAQTGYGFTENSDASIDSVDSYNRISFGVPTAPYDLEWVRKAVADAIRPNNSVEFRIDLEPGDYKIDIYASYFDGSNNYYNGAEVLVNGESIGTVSNTGSDASGKPYMDEVLRSTIATVGEEGYLLVQASNTVGGIALLNAVLVREVTDTPDLPDPDATVESYDEPDAVTVYLGDTLAEADLPATVTVYLSDETEDEAAVVWDIGSLDLSETGEKTLRGTLPDYDDYEVQMKVIVLADSIIAASAPADITVEVGTDPASITLPATVEVTYTSGKTGTAAVDWGNPSLDLSAVTIIELDGTVEGYGQTVKQRIIVVDSSIEQPGFLSIEAVSTTVYIGGQPVLPDEVTVILTDNSRIAGVAVEWNLASASYDTPGPVDVSGQLTYAEETHTVYAQVTVINDTALSVDSTGIPAVTVAYGAAVDAIRGQLPATLPVTYASGRVEETAVDWDIDVDTTQPGTHPVSGTVAGFTVTASVTVEDEVVPVDFTKLEELYSELGGIEQGNYTDLSWQELQTALNRAKDLLDNRDTATQNDVDKAWADLVVAKQDLTTKEPEPGSNSYTVLSVTGSPFTGEKDIVIVIDADMEDVEGVYLGGNLLTEGSAYTLASGSTIVTLPREYLAGLADGDYLLTVLYAGGRRVDVPFQITLAPTDPGDNSGSGSSGGSSGSGGSGSSSSSDSAIAKTGDENTLPQILWLAMVLLALGGMAVTVLVKRKARSNRQ